VRRRRFRIVIVVLALSAAVGIGATNGGGAKAIEQVPGGPTVYPRAFVHHGLLAFVSRGKLWLLNGESGSLREVASPPGFVPQHPVFSPDGTWVAYLEQHTTPSSQTSRLWLAKADGSDAHAVSGFEAYDLIGWRPGHRDLLAVSTGPAQAGGRPCPCASPTRLRLVTPSGSARTVAQAGDIYGAAWSSDGRLAVSEITERWTAQIVAVSPGGGRPQVWFRRTVRQQLDGMRNVLLQIAGFWPPLGIGFWVFGDGAVHNNDAAPLNAVGASSPTPRLLTLSDGTTDEVAGSATGAVAVVTDRGGGRSAWQGKRVVVCTPSSAGCVALPHPSETVTVDPSWSPDGRTLAYVVAPDYRRENWSQRNLARWFADHRVFLYNPTTKKVRELPAARGATSLTWSGNGESLLYVRDNALWLLPALRGRPTRIAMPLFAAKKWPQYFAQIAWSAQFAWSSR
jgi:TolB protein